MAIGELTAGTALIKKSVIDAKIQEMHDVAKKHGNHKMTKAAGDSKHPGDIKWSLMDGTKVLYSGSIPMTAHTAGDGNKNIKPAIKTLNDAIKHLNGLK